jgi:anaerobic selenocysteine-containing dehydrogenase
MVRILLDEDLYDRDFVRNWVNWSDYLQAAHPERPRTFEEFIAALKEEYAQFTPEFAASETGVPAERIVEAAHAIARAGSRFATHSWRAAAAGNLWGWQITRCLYLLWS